MIENSSYWAPELQVRLSQGDVVGGTPCGVAQHPCVFLKKATIHGGQSAWVPAGDLVADASGVGHWLARGRVVAVLVLSHSCDLDKTERIGRVIVAPVAPAANVSSHDWNIIRARRRFSLLPLPDLPGLGDAYADLRSMTAVDRRFLSDGDRIASMSEDGLMILRSHVVGWIARP